MEHMTFSCNLFHADRQQSCKPTTCFILLRQLNTNLCSFALMLMMIMIHTFGWNEACFSCENKCCDKTKDIFGLMMFGICVALCIAEMISGLILIIECRVNACHDENIFLSAGILQIVSAILIGGISYLYNPAFLKNIKNKLTPE